MILNPHSLPKARSGAIMRAMADMPCTLRLAGFLGRPCAPQETVVGCHLPLFGKGMGTKVSDLYVAAGCHACHDLVDRRVGDAQDVRMLYPTAFWEQIARAHAETLTRLWMAGVIVIPDADEVAA